MSTKREAEKQFKRVLKELDEEKMEIHVPGELLERIDRVLECLSFNSREELILSAVRRLLDKYRILEVIS